MKPQHEEVMFAVDDMLTDLAPLIMESFESDEDFIKTVQTMVLMALDARKAGLTLRQCAELFPEPEDWDELDEASGEPVASEL